MKFHIIRHQYLPKCLVSPLDADRMRFFIRKTLTYGNLVKMKHKESCQLVYCSSFALGFSCYVIVNQPSRQPLMSNVKAVVVENEDAPNMFG